MKNQGRNYPDFNNDFDNENLSAKFAPGANNPYGEADGGFEGFASRKDMLIDSVQRYWENCKVMMWSSLAHLKSPVTIIVIILLIATYILLGYAGTIGFQFYNIDIVQIVKTNLDIVVNAVLGFFFGPVTCAIGVALCCVVRMIVKLDGFYAIYFACATVAGFMHGWILYRHKTMWFGTRFRGFYTDLLSKIATTRFLVSTLINIGLLSLLYATLYDVPVNEYLMLYSKSGVELTSMYEFFSVLVVSLLFEILIVFVTLSIINFIVMKAFPAQFDTPELILDENGTLINVEDEEMLQ